MDTERVKPGRIASGVYGAGGRSMELFFMNWQKQVDEFKREINVEPLTISTSAIRFGFFGFVGSGKSTTAGIFAIGITPTGLIGWIDGEGHRSGWAGDVVCKMAAEKYGGTKDAWKDRFVVVHIDPPFNPLRVVAAMEVLEEKGCKTIILDILSQCWNSDGGYLDLKSEELDRMLTANRNTTEAKASSAAAAHIKPWTHQKLVNKVVSSKTNCVLLFQAKNKYNAKTFKPDDNETPIQESGLTTTAIAVGRVECNQQGEGGYCSFQLPTGQGAKHTHSSILAALPKNGEQFKFEHAEAILKLCGGTPADAPARPLGAETADLGRGAGLVAPVAKAATDKTRTWALMQLSAEWGDELLKTFAEQSAYLLPTEPLTAWPLAKIPTDKTQLAALSARIKAFKETGNV